MVETDTIDELHGVIAEPVVMPNGEDRDDVRVVQSCGGPRLAFKPAKLDRIKLSASEKHLERNAAVERELLGFEHDPHSATAELANDFEVAEPINAFGKRALLSWRGHRL